MLATIHQKTRTTKKMRKKKKSRTKNLDNCPQKLGVVLRVYKTNPRKPNSAMRRIARVKLSNNKKISCYLKGEGAHNFVTVQRHANLLIEGGGPKDLPGINYRAIRGKFEFKPIIDRKTKRSKYGKKRMYD